MPLTNGSTPTQVNTTTADNQSFSTVADLPGIGYVVIWQGPGYNPNFPLEIGIYGQCYNYAGEKLGGEFVVSNNFVTGFKADADVIGGPGGTFTVTWSSFDSASLGIYMKTMSVGGGTVSPEVQVNTVSSGSEELSQVVRLSNGNIAVIWQGTGNNPGETGIFARLYDSSQQALGGQFQVNTTPSGFGSAPSLTATFGAGFVAAWSALGANGDSDVFVQLIDHTGAKVGSEIVMNLPGQGAERNPVITTLTNGTYVVAWDVGIQGQGSTEIYAQRFGLNGEKIGDQIHVTSGDFTGARPAIAATPDGGFAVTYQSGFQTMLRTYDDIGRAGDPWPIAEDVTGLQSRPDIALLGDGSFITSFHNGEIYTERFRVTDYLTEGNDRAMGTGDSDYLSGFGGNDILRGGDGDDILEGGLGADRLIGGAGRDEVTYANAASAVSLNLLTGGHSGEAQGDSFEQIEQISLTRFDDRVIGGDLDDVIYGLGGDDILSGGAGINRLDGGEGNDLLEGGIGTDILIGGEGVDEVTYVHANFGLAIDLEKGFMAGAAAADSYSSIERFTLTRFFDEFRGGADADRVAGGGGNDILFGRGGSDMLDGNDGNDLLDGGTGIDQLTGGLGDDLYYVDDAADLVLEFAFGGADRAIASASYSLAAKSSVETLEAAAGSAAVNLTGNELANILLGNDGANTLSGREGNDMLDGRGGNDIMLGGAGSDTFVVDSAQDQVLEAVGEGNDQILTNVSYTLMDGQSVETLSTSAHGALTAIDLVGNQLNNSLFGNYGNNLLNGGGGIDVMTGFFGNDTYVIDNTLDLVIDTEGGGSDVVLTYVSHTLTNGNEVETLSTVFHAGTTAIDLGGNDYANHLIGNYGDNYLNGGGGADRMTGFFGNDTYVVDNAGDVVEEAAGGGGDTVFTFVGYTLGAGQEVEVLSTAVQSGIGALDLAGNGFAQTIFGNNGANVIDGKGGSDALVGFGGADSFAFTAALGASNVDSILDFNAADDTILLDDAVFAGLGLGALAAGAFVTGGAAQDANDRIVYNQATGALFFDADGSGAGAAVQFATLTTLPSLSAADFLVI